ncbi:MAG: ABC transporter ATP-binding protein [Smithellaceae bacterium]
MPVLLDIQNLKTVFHTARGTIRAVDGVSLSLDEGETIGIVGESGCGKTMLALSVMRLIAANGRIASGRVLFQGEDLLGIPEEAMREKRGDDIAMIFQEPMTSLNPVLRAGEQIAEAIRLHQKLPKREAQALSVEKLREVGIPDPERRARDYPHQLSGGMRQRVMIAMAMSCQPKLLLADEPTTALDVTIQAQILDLISELQKKNNMAVMLITHDLGVVAEIATRVAVMYAGRVVEAGSAESIFAGPFHPYTLGLILSRPSACDQSHYLKTIPGTVPSLYDLPSGCRFRERCTRATAKCGIEEPGLQALSEGHYAACWNPLLSGGAK